ncbi:MAG: hypothetical protein FWE84_02435 [Firmicutes bacterium]|nr:hypothetical protein [Bacillota bacterium]
MSIVENISQLDVEACEETVVIESNEVEVEIVDLTLTKTVSCEFTFPGGVLTFCTLIENESEREIEDALFRDALDDRLTFIAGTFTVNGVPTTPVYENNTLEYLIPLISPESEIEICFDVRVERV